VLLLTYDEHGGYYDHVPPPPAIAPDSIGPTLEPGENGFDGFHRYGIRVPFALISPWARRHFVSHQVYDHTSILKLVETKWNLPALTYRDASSAAMLDMLDLRWPSFAEPPPLAQPLAVSDPSALSCSVNGPGTIPPPGSISGSGG
jgi:phospholipase C